MNNDGPIVLPEDQIIPIDTEAVPPSVLDRAMAGDRPWSGYTGMERVYVRQRFRHGESHHETADALRRGHESDWRAQEASGIPVYKRRHVMVLRQHQLRKPRKRERGEFTRALVHLCATAWKRKKEAASVPPTPAVVGSSS